MSRDDNWDEAVAIVAKARDQWEPGSEFWALNQAMEWLSNARYHARRKRNDAVTDPGPIETESSPEPAYPERIWLHPFGGGTRDTKPTRPWEWQDYMRADLNRAPASGDPHDDPATPWRDDGDGDEWTIVPLLDDPQPGWLRPDDGIAFERSAAWVRADSVPRDAWIMPLAFILRRRPEYVTRLTRYRVGPDGKPLRCTCGCAEIVEDEE